MRKLILIFAAAVALLAQRGGGGGSGSSVIACVGTPGNTDGSYRQQCQTSGGAIWACNNAAGCTTSADWVAVASGGATIPATTNVLKGDGAGNASDTKVAITAPSTAATIQFVGDNETVVLPGGTLVANSRTVNGHALSSNVTVTNADLGAVPTTTTVNGHALSANVTVSASDVSLGSVTNDAQTKAAVMPNTAPSSAQFPIGTGSAYVPQTMSGDCTISASGVETCLHVVTFTFDGGGSAISTGACGQFPSTHFSGTIFRTDISADQSGSFTLDIWKHAAGTIPASGDKISASAPVTLSSAQLNQNGSISGWTTAVAADDVWGCTVATAATVTKVTVQIWMH